MNLPLRILASILLLSQAASGQAPADDLNGKTIHLYVESDAFSAFYFQNGDLPFTRTSEYRHTITLAERDVLQQDFYFSSNGNGPVGQHYLWKLGKTGLDPAAEVRFTVADFQGKDTMWVIVDPAGPLLAPPVILLEAPRIVNILNPWPATAPVLVWGGNKVRKMSVTPGRCGWFTSMLLDPAIVAGQFAEVNGGDTYGRDGLGSTTDFDFAALFDAQGKSIWLNADSKVWTRAWPGIDGVCRYMMAAMARDFSQAHPDFDFIGVTGDRHMKGMVESALGPDRKPVSTGIALVPPVTYDAFDSWWKTDSTHADPSLRGYESCIDIPMSKSSDGQWEYDSYRDSPSDRSFFPLEGPGHNKHGDVLSNSCYVMPPPDASSWVTNGPKRNGNFCLESHATFIYTPGQTFTFRGDDDVWIFINDKLVVDLGGVHTPMTDSVALDKLGLVPGQEYKWDFFYCDRQPCASSLRMKTSIYFRQLRPLYLKSVPGPAPGSISTEIWKRTGGTGSCVSAGGTAEKPASEISYQLLDAAGKLVEILVNGGTYHGGITLATPLVTIDTSKITTAVLIPGTTYRIVASETANPKSQVEIPFRIPGSATSLLRPKAPAGTQPQARPRNALGRKVPAFPNRVHSPATFQKTSSP